MPVVMENFSFQSPALAGVGIFSGDVIFAGTGDLEARVCERIDHAGAVADGADTNLIEDPIVDRFATLSPRRRFNRRPHFAGALWVQRVCPTVRFVHQITQAGKGVLMSRRSDVQRLARAELKAWRAEVQLDVALMRVAHPETIVLIPVQPRKGQSLK
ncbi:hypothetical protein GCM10016455_29860 [Aliiroseovarius zhejiangensis]|uniref:Uncharacterized protein n=1 Tax=Aliiroseovarius zhejiangensis TaxID=1632025 RepID=A0ABQ3J7U7_9RHOB|nr:hypothetical protein GCM10016455_29860 [Aliiroseovarius zhejiangensis]